MNHPIYKKMAWTYPLLILALLTAVTTAFGQGEGGNLYLPIVLNGGSGQTTPTPPVGITPTVTPVGNPTATVAPPRRDQSVFGVAAESASTADDIALIGDAGVDWLRPGPAVDWAAVEPVEGARDWSALAVFEAQALSANAQGQSIIATIGGTPDWALLEPGSGKCGPLATDKMPAFAAFLQDLVGRYSRPPYNVRDWELWDKPESLNCWGSEDALFGNGGVFYALMLQTAYPTIHAVDPYATVWMGPLELRCSTVTGGEDCLRADTFLKAALRSGGDYLDGIAFHANDGLSIAEVPWGVSFQYNNGLWQSAWNTTGPAVHVKTAYLNDVIAQIGRENGMPTKDLLAHVAEQCPCGGESFPEFEAGKANYVAQVYTTAIANGLRAAVWQSWQGPYMTGLRYGDGSLTPSYSAMQTAAALLEGAVYSGQIPAAEQLPPGVQGYRFTRADSEIWFLWYASTAAEQVSPGFDELPLAAWDVLGNALDTESVVLSVDHPVYVQFPLP